VKDLDEIDGLPWQAKCRESFPIELREALIYVRSGFCTAIDGMPGTIYDGHFGYLVPSKDSPVLVPRRMALLAGPQTAHRMGRVGRNGVDVEVSLDRGVAAADEAFAGHFLLRQGAKG
jgi:hypothetical protein